MENMENIDISILNDKTMIGTYKESSIYRDMESIDTAIRTFLIAYRHFFPEPNPEKIINHL